MADRLIWVRVTQDAALGGRQLQAGTVLEVTQEAFRALVGKGMAVPCGERGRVLTVDRVADIRVGGRA